jgi:DNA-binding GntR family transcriptional regulator
VAQHPYAVLMAGETAPKYRQIADDLRSRILGGEYLPGSRVPSKAALMEQHRVSLNTVNDAMKILIAEGMIRTVQGLGTFVCDPLPGPQEPSPEYRELSAQIRLLAGRMDAAEAWIAEQEGRRQ